MSSTVQEPPSAEHSTAHKATGFPEPLSPDRNTTLPHPTANTDPNASIEASDVAISKAQSRIHVHLPGFHRHGAQATKVVTDPSEMYKGITYADGSVEERAVGEVTAEEGEASGGENGEKKGKGGILGILRKKIG